MAEEKKQNLAVDLEVSGNEIVSLLNQAINDDNVTFNNPHLVACWEKKDCKKDAYSLCNQKKELRCWQIAGTYCGGKIQGQFAEKYQNCLQCDVYMLDPTRCLTS